VPPAFDVVVLGDANPDLVLSGGDVEPSFGQAEHLVETARLTVGGSGAILACATAKLGLRVALCGVVGDDLFGRFMCEEVARRGVDVTGLVVDTELPTGLTVVLSKPADRAMLTMPGAIGALSVDMVDAALLYDTRHVHVSSYFLQRDLAPGLPGLFERLRASNVTTSVDPNWDPAGSWDSGVLELLDVTDVFLPNEMEATRIARISEVPEAIRRLRAHARIVVVKEGGAGAVAGGDAGYVRTPPIDVEVVDTTGAGDAFDAGFLAAFLSGASLEGALALANACGAISTRATGGVDGLATMQEAETALGSRLDP
jgi:sugar/nucleoside kinase (ribokinase family)